MVEAALVAVGLGVDVLGVFGACMGSVSGQRRYVAATRMELAGLAVAAISALVPG
jgi:VIT1/CCC1 family predicted Fe2+/Mn2+ transporter